MHQEINIKNTLFILTVTLVVFSKSALACEKLSIAELQYMEKDELIKTGCSNNKYISIYMNQATKSLDLSVKAIELGSNSMSNKFKKQYDSEFDTAICHSKNSKTILNVLRKDHAVSTDGFYDKNCDDM